MILLILLFLPFSLFSTEYYYFVKSVEDNGKQVRFTDGSGCTIGWWYTSVVKKWNENDRVKVSYHKDSSNYIKLKNIDTKDSAWGILSFLPYEEYALSIKRIPSGVDDPDAWKKVVLNNGFIFHIDQGSFVAWHIKDALFILHTDSDKFQLWNRTINQIATCSLIGTESPDAEKIKFENVLELEMILNKRVISQEDATRSVYLSLLNYAAGIKPANKPIGVYLFIGPTGVGKTELAKVLADELFHSPQRLVRFDMSHFNERNSLTRFIGSPPGYVNHEEGGQLSEALKEKPQTVILLDEMEKAHPQVQKVFLPIFDEGYLTDAKGQLISCSDAIFIMTSNLYSQDIVDMFMQGYTQEEILHEIEPDLMKALSPELYNRLEVILFHPLDTTAVNNIVNKMLNDLQLRLYNEKKITLVVDDSVANYVISQGFHNELGARPFAKLIEKVLVPPIAEVILKAQADLPSTIYLRIENDDEVVVSF